MSTLTLRDSEQAQRFMDAPHFFDVVCGATQKGMFSHINHFVNTTMNDPLMQFTRAKVV
ncbi:hypothetical protein [Zhongshania borealis]|uniref:Uncharacterized protein n=1 Tax=Zhongshania borealis TaxID=889488 RepID=A0ABP7WSP3_9GAMM